jgi:hypothetical protein
MQGRSSVFLGSGDGVPVAKDVSDRCVRSDPDYLDRRSQKYSNLITGY